LLRRLDDLGTRPRVLKVIPNEGRHAPATDVSDSWIATSPRRLHEGPFRLGLVRVFARWPLGHVGIWRDRPY
jgi:hypothetical protein